MKRDPKTDGALEAAILELLEQRTSGATICPSEAAKAVGGTTDERAWRDLMEPAREAARRLVAAGEIEITQRGQVVDPSIAKGPIRLRKVSGGRADRRVRPSRMSGESAERQERSDQSADPPDTSR